MIKMCINNQGIFNFSGAAFMHYSISILTLTEHSQIIRCEVDCIRFIHCIIMICRHERIRDKGQLKKVRNLIGD